METKKEKIVSAVATIGIVLMLFGATYAYFISRSDAGKTTDVEITANTVDVFSFETGDLISISLDQESFSEGTGDKSGTTYAKATLTPNNKTNTATNNYYLYLNISSNTFGYSLGSDKPEILLQVTDADGATVTNLDGLSYTTITNGAGESVSGFDITTKTGLITLANNKEITANTTTKEDTWNIRVVFINYNENQADNAGNNFKAKLMIQEKKITFLKDWVIAQYTGTQGDNNLYYHDSTLANGAGDNSYRYAGEDVHDAYYTCTYKENRVYSTKSLSPSDNNHSYQENCASVYTDGQETPMYVDKSIYDTETTVKWDNLYGRCTTISGTPVYTYDMMWNLPNDGLPTEEECIGNAYKIMSMYIIMNNFTFVGEGVATFYQDAGGVDNNYVCFGSDAPSCPDDNLYRIIGVFGDQVKLIKWDYANSDLLGTDGDYDSYMYSIGNYSTYKGIKTKIDVYYWNQDGTNTWSASKLNVVNLNKNYINNIGSTWADKIAKTTWKVGGNTWEVIATSAMNEAYQNEIVLPAENTTYTDKIGLMYVNDYGYAANPIYWTYAAGYSSDDSSKTYSVARGENWMYMGLREWTIVRDSADNNYSLFLDRDGDINSHGVYIRSFAIRPVFYLNSDVTYVSGSGTKTSPIRIN